MYADPDPVDFVLSLPLESEPGAPWNYSGELTSILGFVIARATGESGNGGQPATRLEGG